MSTTPRFLLVNPDGIPDALKLHDRWVTWRSWWDDRSASGRWVKRPDGKVNDATTWVSFETAFARYRADHLAGIGFVLGEGFAGIDLDDYDEGPVLDELRATGAYVERSPSATGWHAIGRHARIGGEIKGAARTAWSAARYFCLTGQRTSGSPCAPLDLDRWFPPTSRSTIVLPNRPDWITPGDVRGTERIERYADDQIAEQILATPSAEKFLRLVRGDLSDYGDDHSRADQALCSMLAPWCAGDTDQIDRLFRQTKLMRPKWTQSSYRLATLRKAVTHES